MTWKWVEELRLKIQALEPHSAYLRPHQAAAVLALGDKEGYEVLNWWYMRIEIGAPCDMATPTAALYIQFLAHTESTATIETFAKWSGMVGVDAGDSHTVIPDAIEMRRKWKSLVMCCTGLGYGGCHHGCVFAYYKRGGFFKKRREHIRNIHDEVPTRLFVIH